MTPTPAAAAEKLVEQLQKSWPNQLQPGGAAESVLADELRAVAAGRAGSLPFFATGEDSIRWVTVAPDADGLRQGYVDLRAWIIPSEGWEDPSGAVVSGTASNPLMTAVSPTGYIRWRSQRNETVVRRIAGRLALARRLSDVRPASARESPPSLLELRAEFSTNLAVGDRIAAEQVADEIDRRQLDTAQNVLFLRVRLWDHFGDSTAIISHTELDRLLRLRMPSRVRLAVLRAFYRQYVCGPEDQADPASALAAFAEAVAPRVSGLLATATPDDGWEVIRLLAYRAILEGDTTEFERLLDRDGGAPLRALRALRPQQPSPEKPSPVEPPLTREEQFFAARQRFDWSGVQTLGLELLDTVPEIRPILQRSLDFLPNSALQERLALTAEPLAPATWADWFTALAHRAPAPLEAFLDEPPPVVGELRATQLPRLVDALTELATTPLSDFDSSRTQLVTAGLSELAGGCLADPEFPRPAAVEAYRLLTRTWADWKRGSAYPPDGQVFLELAEGLLRLAPSDEDDLVRAVEEWWKVRAGKALLPFALSAIELFDRLGSPGRAEGLWALAGGFVRGKPELLSRSEKLLWRQVGRRIGYNDTLLDEYVPLPSEGPSGQVDPLRAAGLRLIAIVSLREQQAEQAREMLAERTDARIIVVADTHGGHGTREAATADVIAYVWSASTHSVFRAFDKIDRRKLAYVQGTSASSVVLAVERWLTANRPSDQP